MARCTRVLWAVNAYWNGDGWNVEANSPDNRNEWNVGNEFLSRYPFLSPPSGGVFASNPFRHPPIMRPVSSMRIPISSNCLFGISFASHAICTKNRRESVMPMARVRSASFSRPPAYVATRNVSSRSRNNASIFDPIPKRSSRPMLRRIGSQRRYNPFTCSITGKSRWGGGRPQRIQLAHGYDSIISVENLLGAWREFVRGKRKKKDMQEFQHHLMENILSLHRELTAGEYKHGPYQHFKISDPKPRDIHKATVRDRLVHHAIYRQLYPFFDRTFIADSYSCRKRKGTHRAMNRFRSFAQKVSKNHTRTCWVLKCDIKKFFASIDQKILLNIVASYIPDQHINGLIAEVVGSFRSDMTLQHATAHPSVICTGLPLGNLTSQLLVNVYMNDFDQFVKHKLKAKYYIRYADDFVILSHDIEWLHSLYRPARTTAFVRSGGYIDIFLRERLHLELHPNKVSIETVYSGIDFLGWVHFPDHRVLRTSTKWRMLKSTAGLKEGSVTVQSYRGMLGHGNTQTLRQLIGR